jgi:exonuclease I
MVIIYMHLYVASNFWWNKKRWKLQQICILNYHGLLRNHTPKLWNFGLHTNVKFKVIFKINTVNFLIIHFIIDFNGNHHKCFGWILRRLWTRNGLLKWQHYICHIKKMKNVDSKKCQSSVKIKIKKLYIIKWRIY